MDTPTNMHNVEVTSGRRVNQARRHPRSRTPLPRWVRIFIATVMACATKPTPTPGAGWPARLPGAAAWLLIAVGIAIGLAPQSLSRFVFGG